MRDSNIKGWTQWFLFYSLIKSSCCVFVERRSVCPFWSVCIMLKCQMILFIHNGTYSFSRIIQVKGRGAQKYMSLIHSDESAKVQKRRKKIQISRIQALSGGGKGYRGLNRYSGVKQTKLGQTWFDEEETDCDATAWRIDNIKATTERTKKKQKW